MKKILLVVGIICLIACVLAFVFFAFSCFGYYHVLDGSAEHFDARFDGADEFQRLSA